MPAAIQVFVLERECKKLVELEGFGVEDFNDFVRNMNRLLSEPHNPSIAILQDEEAKQDIQFHWSKGYKPSITVRGKPVALSNRNIGWSETYHEALKYEKTHGEPEVSKPYLITEFVIPVTPTDFQFSSYVTGESKPVFPKGEIKDTRWKFLTDDQAQEFCKKVYGVYLKSQQNDKQLHTSS